MGPAARWLERIDEVPGPVAVGLGLGLGGLASGVSFGAPAVVGLGAVMAGAAGIGWLARAGEARGGAAREQRVAGPADGPVEAGVVNQPPVERPLPVDLFDDAVTDVGGETGRVAAVSAGDPREVEDGPLREADLLSWGQSAPVEDWDVAGPERVLDWLGPMVHAPGGRLVSEAWPRGLKLDPLRVMVVPVTEALWTRVMNEQRGHWRLGAAPVTDVSWEEAIAFCNAASDLAGYERAYNERGAWIPWADGFRLPTEAEWEYVYRAGTRTLWPWGDDEGEAALYAWFGEGLKGRAHAVGRKRPNPWGLYDMHGNVWECCWSGSVAGAQDVVDAPAAVAESWSRALRGGSFIGGAASLRSSSRSWVRPKAEDNNNGFRCVRGVRRQPWTVEP